MNDIISFAFTRICFDSLRAFDSTDSFIIKKLVVTVNGLKNLSRQIFLQLR